MMRAAGAALKRTDIALHRARNAGRGRYALL
jgi:GGDEF domain-containing protein